MKSYVLATIALLFSLVFLVIPAQAQESFYVTALTPQLTKTSFIAPFRVDNPPPYQISFFAWIGEDGQPFSTWRRNRFVANVQANTTMPFTFQAEFNFENLGLVPNKTYSYAIADRPGESGAVFFNTPGDSIRECFTITSGPANCNSQGANQSSQVSISSASSQVDTSITSGTQNQTTTRPPKPETVQVAPVDNGGIIIEFPEDQQVYNDTSAQMVAYVQTTLKMPIDLVWNWGLEGGALGPEERLIQASEIPPGVKYPVLLSFPNITRGDRYSFVITNKVTGIAHTRSFAVPYAVDPDAIPLQLGIDPNSASFTDPGGFTPVADTISDRGLVPRCGRTAGPGVPEEETVMCSYKDFLQLISNVIQYLVIIIAPIIAILVMYIGAMIIWLGKIPDKTSAQMEKLRALQGQLGRIAVGILIMLSSYMIVATILTELGVKASHILIDIIG